MGVFKSVTLYRTDGGVVMAVDEMTSSHLLNAIHHHLKQVSTIDFLKEAVEFKEDGADRLVLRKAALKNTINVLGIELASRDPKDEEMVVETCSRRNFEEREY